MTNKLIEAGRWAFGKDGINLTVYLILSALFFYINDLLSLEIPEAVLLTVIGIVLNLTINALKAEIAKWKYKFERADKILKYMYSGIKFDTAVRLADDTSEQKTEFIPSADTIKKPDPLPLPPSSLEAELIALEPRESVKK